jgi:hypothetical protein
MKKSKGRALRKACSVSDVVVPSRRQRTLMIRGQRWKIRWVPNLGQNLGICDYEQRVIRIAQGQKFKDEIDTVVHELLHAALHDVCEEAVHQTANALVESLLKLKLLSIAQS